jgi:hypothetical protein
MHTTFAIESNDSSAPGSSPTRSASTINPPGQRLGAGRWRRVGPPSHDDRCLWALDRAAHRSQARPRAARGQRVTSEEALTDARATFSTLCRSCEAPMVRQKYTCRRCGARTMPKHGPRSALQKIPGGAFAQRQHARQPPTPTTVLGNARATTQAQLGTARWIDEGGSLGAEANGASDRRGDDEAQSAIEHENSSQFPPNRACRRRPPQEANPHSTPSGGALQC